VHLVLSKHAVAVVRLPAGTPAPDWAVGKPLVSVTFTARETSVICPTASLPDELPGPVEGPLVAATVQGQLDFSQVGVLVSLLKPLADGGIPVLTVSTFDTDWVLVSSDRAAAAASVWRQAGFTVTEEGRR
jgi:uncharacterized protein